MSKEVVWVETRHSLSSAIKAQPKNAAELFEFYAQAAAFSTWYFSVCDRAQQDPVNYLRDAMLRARNSDKEIPVMNASVFGETQEVCEQFLDGHVDLEKTNDLAMRLQEIQDSLEPSLRALFGRKSALLQNDCMGIPKILADQFYPGSLIEFILQHVNDKGFVTLDKTKMTILKALIADEACALLRIGKEDPERPGHAP